LIDGTDFLHALCAGNQTLRDYGDIPIILDPVMVSKGGQKLLINQDALEALKKELIPMARLVTPNFPGTTQSCDFLCMHVQKR
jgi:hydroxymethylpyrimidine/phosphomethylpyrimidine kinase